MRLPKLIGFIGTALIASSGGDFSALALPIEEVQAKLQPIPVFAITNEEGNIWTITGENESQLPVLFISFADAQEYQQNIENRQPELQNKLSVSILSLGEAYQQVKSQDSQQPFAAAFVPMEQEVNSAIQLLERRGQQLEQFPGVPVFFPTVQENNNEGYLVIRIQGNNGDIQGIPFFFEKQQLQKLLEEVKTQRGDNQPETTIQVIPLETLINTLETENDEALENIILFRSQESENIIREIREQQQ